MRTWLKTIGAIVVVLFASPAWANDETQAFGDHGDADYHDICPAGRYMTGAQVRSGLWIDQIAVTCSVMLPGGALASPRTLMTHGGETGSPPYERDCPQGSVVVALDVATIDNRRVSALKFICRPAFSPATTIVTTGNPKYFGSFGNPPRLRGCPRNEAAIGLHGGYGKDVNSAGLICGPLIVPTGSSTSRTTTSTTTTTSSSGVAATVTQPSTSTAAPFNNKVLEYARNHSGQRLGRGECTDLVVAALAYAGARPGDTSSPSGVYIWGRVLNIWAEAPQPGDIIQLVGVTLSYRTANSYGTLAVPTQHSAIIESVINGRTLNVIQQNAPIGSPVQRGVIDFNWTLDSGTYRIFRPISL